MQKIIIKHLVGSKANQSDAFEMPVSEINFGRDHICQVAYDPETDNLVSRLHCRLTTQNEREFLLTDLHSSNGTYVNDKKITTPYLLKVGDIVQLGKNSVKFAFDLEPRPAPPAPNRTKLGDTIIDPTSQHSSNQDASNDNHQPAPPSPPTPTPNPAPTPEPPPANRNREYINYGFGILSLLVIGFAGYTAYNQYQLKNLPSPASIPMPAPVYVPAPISAPVNPHFTATEIASKFTNSTVLIESRWQLKNISTGKPLFQRVACASREKHCEKRPWYVSINNKVEPLLVPDNITSDDIPIGGSGSGSGFVVKADGYIMTNRHVVDDWHFSSPENPSLPGYLVVCHDEQCSKPEIKDLPNDPDSEAVASLMQWVPEDTIQFQKKPNTGLDVESNHELTVTLPNSASKIPAHIYTLSDDVDMALIKIDTPKQLQAIEINANDTVSAGDNITILGYPGVSPIFWQKNTPQIPSDKDPIWKEIAKPSVTGGNVSKVNEALPDNNQGKFFNEMGDAIQLKADAGHGNSGGPVFNDKGHVIGIYTYMITDKAGTTISFATPIKHGQTMLK